MHKNAGSHLLKIQLSSALSSLTLPLAIQLDESAGVPGFSQLRVYFHYVPGASVKEEFLSIFEHYYQSCRFTQNGF